MGIIQLVWLQHIPKKTFLTPWYAHARNVSFSENFVNVLNEWCHERWRCLKRTYEQQNCQLGDLFNFSINQRITHTHTHTHTSIYIFQWHTWGEGAWGVDAPPPTPPPNVKCPFFAHNSILILQFYKVSS